jgi:opacity protein-like surface antigen
MGGWNRHCRHLAKMLHEEKRQTKGDLMGRWTLVISLLAVACATSAVAKDDVSRFDGTWNETVTGGPKCPGTFKLTFGITSGNLVQPGCSGTVDPNGTYSGSCAGRGFNLTATGRFSGNSASGQYTRTDGCSGRWEARKQ